jgi:hypothetical protein
VLREIQQIVGASAKDNKKDVDAGWHLEQYEPRTRNAGVGSFRPTLKARSSYIAEDTAAVKALKNQCIAKWSRVESFGSSKGL